jgi:hypothetical protein
MASRRQVFVTLQQYHPLGSYDLAEELKIDMDSLGFHENQYQTTMYSAYLDYLMATEQYEKMQAHYYCNMFAHLIGGDFKSIKESSDIIPSGWKSVHFTRKEDAVDLITDMKYQFELKVKLWTPEQRKICMKESKIVSEMIADFVHEF